MKKRACILTILLLFIYFFQNLPLSTAVVCEAGEASCILSEQFGLNQSQIPTDPEEIRRLYLQKEWTEFISKNKILGPINSFFTEISLVFKILFAHPYEISLTLASIMALWFLALFWTARSVESSKAISGGTATLIGVAGATLLAQIRLLKVIATFLLDLIFRQENWWIRSIILILIVGALVFTNTLSKLVEKYFKKKSAEKVHEEEKEDVKEVKTIINKAEER